MLGTTEKLSIPVLEFVKNLYSCKFNEGINLVQLEDTLPSNTVETKYIALEMPVETVACFNIIDIKIAIAI